MIRLRPSGADEVLIKRVRDWYEPGPGVFIAPQALFNPALLFTTGVNGTWYDPSDLTTLYQDAAGTTPVTAVEQPVGLMLDKSKGSVLGPELFPTLNFATWLSGGNVSSVTANSFTTTASGGLYQYIPGWSNTKTYKIRIAGTTTVAFNFRNADSGSGLVSVPVGAFNITLNDPPLTQGTTTGTLYFQPIGAGTVTVAEFSVRELQGNHAFNPSGNSANFPVLSARYNLLTKTEDFSDAVWVKGAGATISANASIAPDGTQTADRITSTGTSGAVYQTNATQNTTARFRLNFKYVSGARWIRLMWYDGSGNQANFWVDMLTGTAGTASTAGTGASISGVAVSIDQNGWVTASFNAAQPGALGYFQVSSVSADAGTTQSASVYDVWGADLRVANDALNQPAYQRVNTATDYDTVGFKPYLKFNGTNQWLQTNSIDFTYGDKMFVCAGVRKLSDAGNGTLIELSSAADANNGAFFLRAPSGGLSNYQWLSRGTALTTATPSSLVAPITNVLSGIGDLNDSPTDKAILRVNGTEAASSTADQGTGNYGNYPLYIGARAGSSLWFNGRLHQLVVAGKQASASEIASTEAFVNQKTGAY